MAQNCVTNARRPCGLPRVRVAGLCCWVVLLGCVAGLNGQVGTLDWLVVPGLCLCRWAVARPRDCHTRACDSEWLISRLVLALPPPAATAAWLRRPRGPAAWPSDWLLGAQGACKSRAAPVSGGLCVLDRLRSHSERHNLSRLLSSIRIGSLPATVRLEPRGARGMSPCEAS